MWFLSAAQDDANPEEEVIRRGRDRPRIPPVDIPPNEGIPLRGRPPNQQEYGQWIVQVF